MKAITLWQPWASLLACGTKKYETRSWATSYRGPIAIHAATRKCDIQHLSGAAHIAIMRAITPLTRGKAKTTMYLPLELLPRGCIIATAELVGCHAMKPYIDETAVSCIWVDGGWKPISGNEALFGDWTPGRYAWEFANMKMLDAPIPAKGRQGLWDWEGGLIL